MTEVLLLYTCVLSCHTALCATHTGGDRDVAGEFGSSARCSAAVDQPFCHRSTSTPVEDFHQAFALSACCGQRSLAGVLIVIIVVFKSHFQQFFWRRHSLATLAQCDRSVTTASVFVFQVQSLKVLVNLSSNPDMMDDIVQAQVSIRNAGPFLPTSSCELNYSFYKTWRIGESLLPPCRRHQLLLCCCLMPKQPLRCS